LQQIEIENQNAATVHINIFTFIRTKHGYFYIWISL